MILTCEEHVKVERYGGGTRWHCPTCDSNHNGYLTTITWTNSQPPAGNACGRPRKVFPARCYTLPRFLVALRYNAKRPQTASPERWAAMKRFVAARAQYGEPAIYERF